MFKKSFLAICLAALTACGGGSRNSDTVSVTGRANPSGALVFGDDKPHSWDGHTPAHYDVHGIDVSRWQGHVDWPSVRRSGISFAFIKATEGGDFVDPMFDANWDGARQAGLPRGAYHYYYFCRSALEQAQWFIANVPRDSQALPPVLDLEWTPHSKTCTYRPDGATIRREAKIFLEILQSHYGKRPVIYTSVDFYHETGIGQLRGENFWLRSVAGHPAQVYPGADWTFWQYTGTGRVPGVQGRVDINTFIGSRAQFAAWK
ncbi:GH25 family lysozyme [Pseudoruegeria sp. SK021]|uniref:glycoside hydrolase family 25 protein n=1 Tax=Pseudoruegeria sp. SK021 TaxID=1933035 RepID=UPI000A257CEA|nr:GH25 family lysozyme [Pseudoruegeria sp. SK021]OSP56145.1 glycoside hydrolase [Pseudoruegeria sp. SK021]